MKLDDIKADESVTMTAGLIRLFAAAGCNPTLCHACGHKLIEGSVFKLVSHTKPGADAATDEMCCDRCGEPELVQRDKLAQAQPRQRSYFSDSGRAMGGYSRPSVIAATGDQGEAK